MEKTQALTPAPWRYEPAPGARTWGRIVSADGAEVAAAVTEGDGRLMAEAPELLEVLREMVARFAPEASAGNPLPELLETHRRHALAHARGVIARAAPHLSPISSANEPGASRQP